MTTSEQLETIFDYYMAISVDKIWIKQPGHIFLRYTIFFYHIRVDEADGERWYICSSLILRYNLSKKKEIRLGMSVEDLRCVLRHHWIYEQEIYPTKRQRLEMSLL